jgi:predicted lysophospholipase L1 biosynthesis ABC-type transport system permease subunit
MIAAGRDDGAGVYRPLGTDAAYPVYAAVHVGTGPLQLAPRLRSLAATVDPALRLNDIVPLDEAGRAVIMELTYSAAATAVVSLLALLLSVTGIYSVMSFTVSRRTREIGIRCALGASRRRIVAPILLRVVGQIALGILLGGVIVVALDQIGAAGLLWLVAAHGLLIVGVCTLACIVPIRRALRIEPTEALNAGV